MANDIVPYKGGSPVVRVPPRAPLIRGATIPQIVFNLVFAQAVSAATNHIAEFVESNFTAEKAAKLWDDLKKKGQSVFRFSVADDPKSIQLPPPNTMTPQQVRVLEDVFGSDVSKVNACIYKDPTFKLHSEAAQALRLFMSIQIKDPDTGRIRSLTLEEARIAMRAGTVWGMVESCGIAQQVIDGEVALSETPRNHIDRGNAFPSVAIIAVSPSDGACK